MFDFGFSEILVILVLALIVLGPERLPSVVRKVGRWVGRARAMARQFQEQLEQEIDLDGDGSQPASQPLSPDPPAYTEPPPHPATLETAHEAQAAVVSSSESGTDAPEEEARPIPDANERHA